MASLFDRVLVNRELSAGVARPPLLRIFRSFFLGLSWHLKNLNHMQVAMVAVSAKAAIKSRWRILHLGR
jgi:hypothetical protein